MRSSRYAPFALLALLIAGFTLGLVHLLKLRFGGGDVYEPYSSLRADPLGAKAFHDSLMEVRGMEVSRNLKPLYLLQPNQRQTVFYLGCDPETLGDDDGSRWRLVRSLAVGGTRVVVSLTPTNDDKFEELLSWSASQKSTTATTSGAPPLSQKGMQAKQRQAERERRRRAAGLDPSSSSSLMASFGLELTFRRLPENPETGIQSRPALSVVDDLKTTVSWHSALAFTSEAPEWRSVLERNGLPVVVERQVGRGSIVFLTDSYLFSNEAAVKERQPALLAWLIGGRPQVIFEETHLGIGEEPGIASLAREYRLHGFAAGIFLLVLLFVWRSASSFLPRREWIPEINVASTDRDAAAGLVHLLRRSIPPSDLLQVCVDEWQKTRTGPAGGGGEAKRLENVLAVAEEERERNPRTRKPIEAYQRISTILNERK